MPLLTYTIEIHGEPATAQQYRGNEQPNEAKPCTEKITNTGSELLPVPIGIAVAGHTVLGVPTINGWKKLLINDWFVTEHNGSQHVINNDTFHFVFGYQLSTPK